MAKGFGVCSKCRKHILIYSDEESLTAKKVGNKWYCWDCYVKENKK